MTLFAYGSVQSLPLLNIHDHPSPYEMDWSNLQVVDRARTQVERRVREVFHIYKRQPKINSDSGLERSAVWNAFL